MPDGLHYAGGPLEIRNGKPASAFSKGDLLVFDSGSSLSYADVLFAAGSIIAGVALSSSTESRRDLVPYVVAKPETKFWIEATPAAAQAARVGVTSDLSADGTGNWQLGTSQNSAIALVRSESSEDASIQQRDSESDSSWVIVSLVSTTLGVGSGAVG